MSRGTVYLSGPMTGNTYEEAVGWRRTAEALFGSDYRVLSPLRGKDYLNAGEEKIKDSYETELQFPMSKAKAIVTRDYNDVQQADVILVNLKSQPDVVSVGTVCEIAWAHALSVPVVAVMDLTQRNRHHHAFLREQCGIHTPSLNVAVQLCKWVIG